MRLTPELYCEGFRLALSHKAGTAVQVSKGLGLKIRTEPRDLKPSLRPLSEPQAWNP